MSDMIRNEIEYVGRKTLAGDWQMVYDCIWIKMYQCHNKL